MCPSLPTSAHKVLAVAEWSSQWVDLGCDGTAPSHQTAGVPWWMFLRRIGNKTNFSFFFFQTGLSMGNFPRTTPLLFHRDVYPLRTLWVVFLKAKGRGKEKEKGKNLVIHPWRLDNNKIHNKVRWHKTRWRVKQHSNILQAFSVQTDVLSGVYMWCHLPVMVL